MRVTRKRRRREFETWCARIREAIESPELRAEFDAMSDAEKEVLIVVGLLDGTLRYGSPFAEAIGVGSAPR